MKLPEPSQPTDLQCANAVLLVRPASFDFNPETAESNHFARACGPGARLHRVNREFEELERKLRNAGVETMVLEDTVDPAKPDAIFPNNWISFHRDGRVVVFPIATHSRRLEKRLADVLELVRSSGFSPTEIVDLSIHEKHRRYLEGTGSLVLDHIHRIAFASLSERTSSIAIRDFCRQMNYDPRIFEAHDERGRAIYHTNVILSLGTEFAVVCVEAIAGRHKDMVLSTLSSIGRTIINVTYEQARAFACNILELRGSRSRNVLAISATAFSSLRPTQRACLELLGGEIVTADIRTIEHVGGGSVRCMIAEVRLPRRPTNRAANFGIIDAQERPR